jgi:hypothetical protein
LSCLESSLDAAAMARLHNVMAGGIWGDAPERALMRLIESRFPGSVRLFRLAMDSHARAAAWGVTEGGCAGVIFAGSGFPVPVHPHVEAARACPRARYWYCDPDPGAVLTSRALIKDPGITVARASSRVPGGLLAACGVTRASAPVMVQLQMAWHWWAAGLAASVTGLYARLLPPGSLLFASALVTAWPPSPEALELLALLGRAGAGRPHAHSQEAVVSWLEAAGLEVLPPGPADVRAWPDHGWAAAGLGGGRAWRLVDIAARVPV